MPTNEEIQGADVVGRELEVRLRYRQGMAPVRQPHARPGEYLGSGDGTVDGPGLHGAVRWDLNEFVGQEACQMFFAGIVETDDGAAISFDTLGFGLVRDPAAAPSRWDVTATVRFETDDPRFRWLAARPVPWVGEFDMDDFEHRYRIVTSRVDP